MLHRFSSQLEQLFTTVCAKLVHEKRTLVYSSAVTQKATEQGILLGSVCAFLVIDL